jgi:hypothetical protein
MDLLFESTYLKSMIRMIRCSLFLNIAVLTPVCFAIISGHRLVAHSWGAAQPSLYLLVSIYCTILIASLYLLIKPNIYLIFSLLMMQVFYKFLSPVLVGSVHNPVVLSNVVIATIHLFSLYSIVNSPGFSLTDKV